MKNLLLVVIAVLGLVGCKKDNEKLIQEKNIFQTSYVLFNSGTDSIGVTIGANPIVYIKTMTNEPSCTPQPINDPTIRAIYLSATTGHSQSILVTKNGVAKVHTLEAINTDCVKYDISIK